LLAENDCFREALTGKRLATKTARWRWRHGRLLTDTRPRSPQTGRHLFRPGIKPVPVKIAELINLFLLTIDTQLDIEVLSS
jgi:hypothetical protein